MKVMSELTPKKKVGEEEMLFFPRYRISVDSAVVPLKFSAKLTKRLFSTKNLQNGIMPRGMQFVYAESTRVSTPGVVSLEVPRRTPPELPREISRETSLYVPSRTSPEFPLHLAYKARLAHDPTRCSARYTKHAIIQEKTWPFGERTVPLWFT